MQEFSLVEALTDLLGSSAQMPFAAHFDGESFVHYDEEGDFVVHNYFMHDITRVIVSNLLELTALPALPEGMESLSINNCPNLTALPAQPEDLLFLTVYNCDRLTELHPLPESLMRLTIHNCPELRVLPALPKRVCAVRVNYKGKTLNNRKSYQKARLMALLRLAVLEWWCKPEQMQKLVAKYGDPAKAYEAIGLGYG